MAEITLKGVTKRYSDGTLAVRDFTLDIADGEFMIFVGPSGCGKSTALRMIAGLEDISEGELRIGSEVVNDKPPRERDIAMVFQNYALYPHMTVRENMAFPLRLAKLDRAEIDRRVMDAAKILDLVEHLDRKPANLSGGQRQRVAMGRAIVRQPKAFLMDEPLSNLDAQLRIAMRTEVSRLQRRLTTTMVYVTHDQVEAMTLGDRVTVMRKGVIQQVDTPANLYARPVNLFVAGFIGSPAMNFSPVDWDGGRLHSVFGDIDPPPSLAERLKDAAPKLVAGIRPEHFEEAEPAGGTAGGVTFKANVELVESLGSEVYVYFSVGAGDKAAELDEVADRTGLDELPHAATDQMVARLNPDTRARRGEVLSLWFDPARLHIFDAETGRSLTS
ncbi:MAG TPA: sn-glycerol-3-phosphate ABC transporter ATP-binding protein UgpC [Actinomycetota bacterium]